MTDTPPLSERDRLASMVTLVSGAFLAASARLSAARTHWDNNEVDGESAYFAAIREVGNALEDAARSLRSQIRKQDNTIRQIEAVEGVPGKRR